MIDGMGLGGAQRFLINLAAFWPHDRMPMEVAALHGPGELSGELASLGVKLHHLCASKFDPRLPFRLRRLVRDGNYDLVHAHLIPSIFLCEKLRRWLGIPKLVAHVHAIYGKQRGYAYQNFLESRIYRDADCVVACSWTALRSLPRMVNGGVVYNGIDTRRFAPITSEARQRARDSLGYANADFVVGTSGRLAKGKNQALLLEAARGLADSIPKLRVLIVGSGPEESNLRLKAQALGIESKVCFAGFRERVENYLAAMDAFVFSSEEEGLGLALIEAMGCGLPCISADFEAAKEINGEDEACLLFTRNSAESLVERIRAVHADADLRARLSERSRARVLEEFSAERMSLALQNLYEGLTADF